MKVVVHVGSAKTGSTAIQRSLFHNRETLKEMGYVYPSIASRPDHLALLPRQSVDPPYKYEFDDDAWKELHAQASRPGVKAIIMSSEQLFERSPQSLKIFDRRIRHLWPDVKYAGYLRSPKSRYLSGVQQRKTHK